MTKISCAVVRDLLPSYVEGIASTETNALVEEHMEGCAACRDALASMRAELAAPRELAAKDRDEIDFLRRNRRHNLRIALTSVAGALLTIVLVLAMRAFVIGSATPAGNLSATVTVEDATLSLSLIPTDSASAVARARFDEQDGAVSVTTTSVLASALHPGPLQASYRATAPIREVSVNGRTVWADGSEVSALASEVFATRHDYVGDMPANGRTLEALGVANYLGALQHELHTDEEPYGWTIYLRQDVIGAHQALMESDMRSFAYVLLGVVGNLSEVSYRYTVDGTECGLAVTAEDASTYLGQDVKACGSNIRVLDELLAKTGLSALA